MAVAKPDFSKWTIPQLREFLKSRNKPRPSLKADLLRLCNIYANTPVIIPSAAPVPDSSTPTDIFRADLDWTEFSDQVVVPKGFDIGVLIDYLSSSTLQFSSEVVDDSEDEEMVVDSSTKKPCVKGRRMYASKKIQHLEYSTLSSGVAFRCNMSASYGKDCRYPRVALDKDGLVTDASCTCIQRADKRCCHVAALLYCIEDIALQKKPLISAPCTSQPQQWGKGAKAKKNPHPLHVDNYGKKRKTDLKYSWDPRPSELKKTDQEDVDHFIKDLQIAGLNSMWQQLLVFEYQDYELGAEREKILHEQVLIAISGFHENIQQYDKDLKSNSVAVHVTGTEDQSDCDLWKQMRNLRITASNVKDFSSNPASQVSKIWELKSLDHIPAIRWGRQSEEKARLKYEEVTGLEAKKCGIFIHRKFPFCGASPDAWLEEGKGIVEIKCPFLIKDKIPTDFSGLTGAQINAFPCYVKDSKLCLKLSHKYFYQVQFQLMVTGAEYCDFVI